MTLNGSAHIVDPAIAETSSAECAILNTLLGPADEVQSAVYDALKPAHFYDCGRSFIFQTMVEMRLRGTPIDKVSVAEELIKKNRLNEVGGAEAMRWDPNLVTTGPSVLHWIKLLQDAHASRQLRSFAHRLNASTKPPHGAIAEARRELDRIEKDAGYSGSADASGLVLTSLADIENEPVSWLWTNRIAVGKLTLFVGDPGMGKSYAATAVGAALTRGRTLPG